MTLKEEWRDIPGYEGLYQVSNLGQIKSLGRTVYQQWQDGTHGRYITYKEKILKPKIDTNNYLSVSLYLLDKSRKRCRIHRLVALAFIENYHQLPCINHKDQNPHNNATSNLEWCTVQYNVTYNDRIDKYRKSRGFSVDQLDLEGNYINTYDSMNQAAIIVYNNKDKEVDIRRNCIGKTSKVLNYKWRYHNDA